VHLVDDYAIEVFEKFPQRFEYHPYKRDISDNLYALRELQMAAWSLRIILTVHNFVGNNQHARSFFLFLSYINFLDV
jgi:hypothetical protein